MIDKTILDQAKAKFMGPDQDPKGLFAFDLPDTWAKLRSGQGHSGGHDFRLLRLNEDIANLTKRVINEQKRIEDFLTPAGMKALSAGLYAMEWEKIYYATQDLCLRRQGYWTRLWRALRGRV